MYGTTAQIANATGVAAVFFAIESTQPVPLALLATMALFARSITAASHF